MTSRVFRPWATLRGRFLLVILLGMALPIALLGPWLARSAKRSGEQLLRSRLELSLAEAANAVGTRWVNHRSSLLRLAGDAEVRAALEANHPLELPREGGGGSALEQAWAALGDVVDRVVVRDRDGAIRVSMSRADDETQYGLAPTPATLPVRMPIYDAASGAQVGTLEARLRLRSLLPSDLWLSGVAGSVLAIFDEERRTPLVPVSFRPELYEEDRFTWDGEDWVVERRRLHEPALEFAIAAPLSPVIEPFAQAARRGAYALAAVLALGVALAVLLTGRITGPLERMATAADDVARGRLDWRLDEQGPDELRRLGKAFNAMTENLRTTLERLAQREAVAAVGEFAASLAHEVRNPLTSIRLDLERAGEGLNSPDRTRVLLARALSQIDRLDTTVRGALRIARSGTLDLWPIDLQQPLHAAMHTAEPAFAARGARLEAGGIPTGAIPVQGNPGALEQLFLNLLLNAAEALGPGGRVWVAVERVDGSARVTIRDAGPGIAPEMLPRVLEPFFTTKTQGTGLGLPIAQRIAQAHGGALHLESTPGEGTTVRLTLATTE